MKTIDGVEKPLKEWTVDEIHKYCHSYLSNCAQTLSGHCEDSCPLYINFCSRQCIYDWDLSEKKKFTEQEIEDAKAVKRILGNGSLYKDNYGLFWTSGFNSIRLNPRLFQSISIGEKILLSEIIGDEND